jgi:hypothetical protein
MLAKSLLRFVRNLEELAHHLLSLKQLFCPFCGAGETLNCHSKLYGNDPASSQGERMQRGQRVWCCSRGQRGGCGRSFSMFLAGMLPRHTVSASALGSLLERLLAGGSIAAAIQALKLPFPLETLYHVLGRLRQRLPAIRSALCQEQPASASSQTDPLLQTVEHLHRLFAKSQCPCTEFQLHFQRPLLE